MLKKITFLLLLFLSSCGYEAINSKKNIKYYEFSLSKLVFDGEREINLRLKEKLNRYTLDTKDKNFLLEISSTSQKIILAKDTSGDATSFQKIIIVNVEVLENNQFKNSFVLSEKFNYSNEDNKFDLKKYEKEITKNLSDITAEKLIFKLSNIQ
mgnify:CR=1 FL=1